MKGIKTSRLRKTPAIFLILVMLTSVFNLSVFQAKARANGTAFTYYVSAETGSDSNDGLSPSRPFKTIQKAHDLTYPGDTVLIMNGTYKPEAGGNNWILKITRSGAPGAYITYKAYPGHKPVLTSSDYDSTVSVLSASYIIIDGLEVYGESEKITYADALQSYNVSVSGGDRASLGLKPEGYYNTGGIGIDRLNSNAPIPHHITVRNCHVHHMPGGGIGTGAGDYITIEKNLVHDNAQRSMWAHSGISLFHTQDVDNNTSTYKNFIIGNVCYNNQAFIPWKGHNYVSDGNGIIIDDNKNEQINKKAYEGKTLVMNNISFNNGGSGIHAYNCRNVDIVNNTAYNNSRSPVLRYGNIFVSYSENCNVLNNIMYTRTGENHNSDSYNINCTYDYNCYFNGYAATRGPHDLFGVNPQFAYIPPYNETEGDLQNSPPPFTTLPDFRLKPESPCIDAGTAFSAVVDDITGTARPVGGRYDIGAYEFAGMTAAPVIVTDNLEAPETIPDGGIENGLLGHWSLDEGTGTTVNSPINNITGVVYGAAEWVDGKSGKALKFNGKDSYVCFPETAALKPASAVTVTAWMAWTEDPQLSKLQYRKPVWMGDSSKSPYGAYGIEFDYPYSGNKWPTFHVASQGRYTKAEDKTNIIAGEWHHIAGVYSGNKEYIYVDGILKNTRTVSGEIEGYTGAALGIGGSSKGTDLFKGIIDDVRIYGRALSANDVMALKNATDLNSPAVSVEPSPLVLTNQLTTVYNENFDALSSVPTSISVSAAPSEAVLATKAGAVNSLKGEYWRANGTQVAAGEQSPYAIRDDGPIDFKWLNGKPHPSAPSSDNFLVVWKGQIKADFSEFYSFYIDSNDGHKLLIDGVQITDPARCVVPGSTSSLGKKELDGSTTSEKARDDVYLTAGWHDIEFSIYEGTGTATARLFWKTRDTNNVPGAIIPADHMRQLSTDKYFRLYNTTDNSGASMEVGNLEDAIDVAVYRFSVLDGNTGSTFMIKEGSTGKIAVQLQKSDVNSLSYYDGNSLKTVTGSVNGNSWHDVKVAASKLTGTYDLYIDGALKVSRASFKETVSRLDVLKLSIPQGTQGEICVDNITVTTDTIPVSITPMTAVFDKTAPADVTVQVNIDNSIHSVRNGSEELVADVDYTAEGTTFIISQSYLQNLPVGTATLTFAAAWGANPILNISIVQSSTISAVNTKVNRYNPSDIPVNIALNGNTLDAIKNGSTALTAGTDYTVADSVYTIRKEYLSTLPVGRTLLTFDFSNCDDAVLRLDVSQDSDVTPTEVVFDKRHSEDISVFFTYNGNNLVSIKNGSYELAAERDYTVSGSECSLSKDYLKTLEAGDANLLFTFSGGVDRNVILTIPGQADTTAPTLTAGTVSRTSDTTGTVKFTSSEAGSYYYAVVADGAAEPLIDTTGTGTACTTAETTITNPAGLTTGAKDIYIKVKDAAGNISNALKIDIDAFSGGSSGNNAILPTPTPAPEQASTGVDLLVNGKSEKNAGTATTAKIGDKTVTTIAVDENKLEQKLLAEGNGTVVLIPVNMKADIVVGEFNGKMVKIMENKQAVVQVKTEVASYTLPAQQINIDAISSQIGKSVELKDIKVQVEIAKSSDETVKTVESYAKKGGFTIVAPPVDFTVKCTSQNKTVQISKFNAYVERTIAIPSGVDPSRITTGIVVEPDGTLRHVPTKVINIDGKCYAKINSLTNSTYSVVWHTMEFKDVKKHWAEKAINDMGARMIISGVGNSMFEPDRDITRAEFAAIVVRGLGLKPGTGKNTFSDVNPTKWYYPFIETAYEYGIVSGFGNGKFGPDDKITREQAMNIIAGAMKITGLKADLKSGEADKLLSEYADSVKAEEWAKDNMAACVKAGIVSGRSGKLLAPKDEITRAEVAVIIQRLLQRSGLI